MNSEPVVACNIGPNQRRRRLWIGVPLLLAGLVASFLSKSFLGQMVAFFGFLSIFQAEAGVCVFLAAGSAQNMDDGQKAIDDPDLIEHFQKRSRSIYWRTFLATLLLILVSRASFIVRERFL
jgi:hypothetical protein